MVCRVRRTSWRPTQKKYEGRRPPWVRHGFPSERRGHLVCVTIFVNQVTLTPPVYRLDGTDRHAPHRGFLQGTVRQGETAAWARPGQRPRSTRVPLSEGSSVPCPDG